MSIKFNLNGGNVNDGFASVHKCLLRRSIFKQLRPVKLIDSCGQEGDFTVLSHAIFWWPGCDRPCTGMSTFRSAIPSPGEYRHLLLTDANGNSCRSVVYPTAGCGFHTTATITERYAASLTAEQLRISAIRQLAENGTTIPGIDADLLAFQRNATTTVNAAIAALSASLRRVIRAQLKCAECNIRKQLQQEHAYALATLASHQRLWSRIDAVPQQLLR